MRDRHEGIERLPNRPRVTASVIDGEYWFVAQDAWEAIGATRQAFRKVPKELTRRIPVSPTKKATAVSLAGLMYMAATLRVRQPLPTENTVLIEGRTSTGEPLDAEPKAREALGQTPCIVLNGAAEFMSALGQVHRDSAQRLAARHSE